MGRRRNDGLMDALVLLPWWVGIGVGLVGFAVIRWGFGAWLSANGGPIGKAMGTQLAGGAFTPFAWFFLMLCCIAAFFSWLRSRQRARLLDGQRSLDTIRAMSWRAFEQLIGEAYRRQGFQVTETGQGGADGGIDLLLRKGGGTTLVQCKHWHSQKVSVNVVREMYGLLAHHGADAVKIICTGVFTADCEAFARGKPIELVDGPTVLELVWSVQAAGPSGSIGTTTRAPALAAALEVKAISDRPVDARARICPRCSAPMALRTNRSNGDQFWGCTSFPKCRGTAPI
jgi:restriction system protein